MCKIFWKRYCRNTIAPSQVNNTTFDYKPQAENTHISRYRSPKQLARGHLHLMRVATFRAWSRIWGLCWEWQLPQYFYFKNCTPTGCKFRGTGTLVSGGTFVPGLSAHGRLRQHAQNARVIVCAFLLGLFFSEVKSLLASNFKNAASGTGWYFVQKSGLPLVLEHNIALLIRLI